MCKDSNEDEWIYIVRTGSCRVIKALTQATPKLKTKKKTQVIYDNFGTKRKSAYSMEALGAFNRVRRTNSLCTTDDNPLFQSKTPIKPAKCYTEIEQIRERSVFVSLFSLYQVLTQRSSASA